MIQMVGNGFLNMLVDHRKAKFFGGIVLQEFDPKNKKLTGPVHYIFEGTELGKTEGPHLYQKDGYYYLLMAEGGTEYGHAMSLARSRNITGPYETHPDNPFISASQAPDHPLQKTGHGDFVETTNGEWYAVFLTGRPLSKLGRCITGRETAIEQFVWSEDGWPRLTQSGSLPRLEVPGPNLPEHTFPKLSEKNDFDSPEINIHFQALRVPITSDWLSLEERPGYLRLYGRESLSSFHRQSLIARRVQHTEVEAATCLEFSPESFQQMAGLVCYYNTSHFYYLHLGGGDENFAKRLQVIACDKNEYSELLAETIDLSAYDQIFLKVVWRGDALQFYYATEIENWLAVGPILDGSILSDDYVLDDKGRYRPAFTGAFVGLCCQDLSGRGKHADFDWFSYKEV